MSSTKSLLLQDLHFTSSKGQGYFWMIKGWHLKDTNSNVFLDNCYKFVPEATPPRSSTSDTLADVRKSESQTDCICSWWENKPLIWSWLWNKAWGALRSRGRTVENHIKHTGISLSCPLSSPCHLRDGCRAWVSFFTPSVIKDHISLPPLIYAWLLHCTWPPYIILPEMVVELAAANMSTVWTSPPTSR